MRDERSERQKAEDRERQMAERLEIIRSERQRAQDRERCEMAERFEIMMRVGGFNFTLEHLPELRQIDDIVCRLIQRENAKKGRSRA